MLIPVPLFQQQLSPPGLMARKDKSGSSGSSPSHSRRAHSQPNNSPGKSNGNSPQNGTGSGSRSKGVPQSFGYKRQANGSGMASNMVTMDAQQHLMLNPQQQGQGHRSTAQVSAVPRGGKIKMMSPGANQSQQDLHTSEC